MSISPSPAPTPGSVPPQQPYYAPPPPAPASGSRATGILIAAVIALAACCGYLFYQVSTLKTDMAKNNAELSTQLDKVREATSLTAQTNRRTVENLRDQLETERRMARMAVGEARSEALGKVKETEQRLAAAQAAATQQVNSKISEVKQSADTANSKVAEVNTEVGTVKTDLGATKSQLEKTIAELKHVTGDVDGHASLIATNGKELAALRALGERNYIEFNVKKDKHPQRVGDVMIQLKKSDPKHNRYTIELTADDKKMEKKDRTINEPLQFYTSKARQPYEIVVNDVKKNDIAGYLAVPKVQNARNQAAGTDGR